MKVVKDGRTVGVIVHHVKAVYPLEIQLAQSVAAGRPVAGVTWDTVAQMNAKHAHKHAAVEKSEALELLRRNGKAAADAVRMFSDEQLDAAAPVSLNADAPLTAQFVIEDHARLQALLSVSLCLRGCLNTSPSQRKALEGLSRVSNLGEDPLVFREDHVPTVVSPDVLATITAHGGAQPLVADKKLQTLDELVPIGIVQPAVASDAMLDEHRAAAIGEDWRADRQRLQCEERQALVRRRTSDYGRRFERLEPLAV